MKKPSKIFLKIAFLTVCLVCLPATFIPEDNVPFPAGPYRIPPREVLTVPFPFPEGLKPQVEFWRKLFTQYTTRQIVIHDDRYVDVIYEVMDMDLRKHGSDRKAWKAAKARRKHYRKTLEKMAGRWDTPRLMSKEEKRIFRLFENLPESEWYEKKDAAKRVRLQLGQSDRFRRGIARSFKYLPAVKRFFREENVPEKLAYLAMIESSFNPTAVSHAGASGMWQFMRQTGLSYDLKVGMLVDERRDPEKSAKAAARLLADNYKAMNSWPLAITAYNYGLYGISKAVRKLGSKDIVRIIEQHEDSRFRFASRNFYAEFLAALEVCLMSYDHFGDITPEKPLRTERVKLDRNVEIRAVETYCGLSEKAIMDLNPALNDAVSEAGILPADYELAVPFGRRDAFVAGYAKIPDSFKHKTLPFKLKHRVKRGQTLASIAKRYKTTARSIARLNAIRNPKRIKPGQVLTIPEG